MAKANGLVAEGVHWAYGVKKVLKGVGLSLRPGEWLAVLGPNGSGKSTLLRVLCGLIRPERGQVALEGVALGRWSQRGLGQALAFLPQLGPVTPGLTVERVIRLGRLPAMGLLGRFGPEDREAVAWAMDRTHTEALAGRDVATLSGGERQRVLLARALAARPRYLLLDEPANHLDLQHQGVMLRLLGALRDEGGGVLSVLHDPNQAVAASRVLLLGRGEVVGEGPPGEVLQGEAFAKLYQGDLEVEALSAGRIVVLPRLKAPDHRD